MDTAWAMGQLHGFIARCDDHYAQTGYMDERPHLTAVREAIEAEIPVLERIFDQAWPTWREKLDEPSSYSWEYQRYRRVAKMALVLLQRSAELDEKLGDPGPSLAATRLHPVVWDAAKALWSNGHYADAVTAAARSVNAQLQAKVQRRDASEGKLIGDSFSLKEPVPGSPRLRIMPDDGSDTYKSLVEGPAAFGRGCFLAIRNVLSHEFGALAEPPEADALEYLAAFSVLARWIDKASLERV